MNISTDRIVIRACAKVNLSLSVGAPTEPSGFHPICSWMHAIGLYDTVEICRAQSDQDSEYSIGWARSEHDDEPVDWAISDDLGVRAHKLVEERVGHRLAVKIRISKSIPAGGGLGGGSSDAAGVLMGMNELFHLDLDQTALVELAMNLGSDIPFFIDPGFSIPRSAIVQGMGEKITRLDATHAGTPITLILPGFGCHTGQVYGAFDSLIESDHQLRHEDIETLATKSAIDEDGLFNDLASAAVEIAPELDEIRTTLQRVIGKPVHVSGSGSTVFVIGSVEPGLIEKVCPSCSVVQIRLC